MLNMDYNSYPSYDDFDLDDDDKLMEKNRFIPKKLFKYTNVHRAKDLLYDNIMYLPEISELNDPYEGELLYDDELLENAYFKHKKEEFDKDVLGDISYLSDVDQKKLLETREILLKRQSKVYIDELKKYMHDGIYFICLSSSNKINSLWAHYANNHDGICIEYDMNDYGDKNYLKNLCFRVEYVKKSDSTRDIKKHIEYDTYSRNLMLKPFLKKSEEWGYEKEWRIILTDDIIVQYSKFYPYKPYIEFFKPSAVYMGLSISDKNEDLVRQICEINEIQLYKARKSNRSYDFDFEKVDL